MVSTVLALVALIQVVPVERTVRGEVRTPEGGRVVGATVWLAGTRAPTDSAIAATTAGDGTFRFTLPVSETSALLVRRRGFRDARVPLTGVSGAAKRGIAVAPVTLEPITGPLLTVVVPDTGSYVGTASTFFRHVASRRGDYVTRADIARQAPARTSSVLRGMRGVTLLNGSGGGTYVRLRSRDCLAAIWLDGSAIGTRGYDVDLIAPQALAGIEVYATPGELPSEYQTLEAMNCGAVAFWTRRGEEVATGLFELASFVDPATVRLPGDVDAPAQLLAGVSFAPSYPGEVRASGVGGTVLVELVVDTTGAVERSSVGLVAASEPELAGPVLHAAERLRFQPARTAGHPVRQLVHVAATFAPAGRRK